jgi:hypothetical protein
MRSTRPLAKTGTDVERLLLAAGADERPDAESVRKAARVLGIVPRAALVAATLGVALRATRWSSVATSIAMWSSVPLGVAGIALLGYSGHAGRHLEGTPAPITVSSRPVVAGPGTQSPGLPALAESPASPAASAPPEAPALPQPSSLPASRGTGHRGVPVASVPVDRLREQAEALEGVRARLALGDAAGALAQLGDYDRRFAGGSLREESFLLRIEALARLGDSGTASALARRFLKIYPASVHADRVAALLQELPLPRTP